MAFLSRIARLAVAFALLGSVTALAGGRFLDFKPPSSMEDDPPPFSILNLGAESISTWDVIETLRKAKGDASIQGIILDIDGASMGLAKLQEVREALLDFKSSGKPIFAYLESGGMTEYYLATAASDITMVPVGELMIVGLSSEAMFLRGTLDLLGINPNYEHIGDYKSYSETFTRKTMSEAQREAMTAMVEDDFAQIVDGIAGARGMTPDAVRQVIDEAPHPAGAALDRKLVDRLLYQDEFKKFVDEKAGGKAERVKFSKYSKSALREGGGFFSFAVSSKPKIAVIYAQGGIASGESERSLFGGATMGSDTVAAAIREAREADDVKAILMRVDSPGGSALASDVIWREVTLAKKQKPVVVSMSNVAGSGGYYISMGASKIVAEPSTITGSIGVVGGKFNLKGLYEKIGITKEAVARGKNALLFSDYRDWNESEVRIVRSSMEHVYKTFVGKAAEGRGKSPDEIHKIGQGRIWTGRQGKELGLVDELGGMTRALALAKELAGVPGDRDVALVTYPKPKGMIDRLKDLFGARVIAAVPLIADDRVRTILGRFAFLERVASERVLALMPFDVTLR